MIGCHSADHIISHPLKPDYTVLDRHIKALGLNAAHQEPLANHGTWHIGGPADRLVQPNCSEQIQQLIACAQDQEIPWIVIGKGSNLLFSDEGIRGLVIKLGPAFSHISIENGRIQAQSGISVPRLAHQTACLGLTGLEHTVGIPCTLGGLVTLNGGSLQQSISRLIRTVTWVDAQAQVHQWSTRDCHFSYRHSFFLFNRAVITDVSLECQPGNPRHIRRAMLATLRTRRERFPLRWPNCGSVFKRHPELFTQWGPPGKIIEDLGLKGYSMGNAMISPQHANFFLNRGRATAGDILHLIHTVRQRVHQSTGHWMECEVIHVDPAGTMQPAHEVLLSD